MRPLPPQAPVPPRSAMQVSRSFLVSGQLQQIFLGLPSGPMGTPGGAGDGVGSAGPGPAPSGLEPDAPISKGFADCARAHG